MNNHSQPILLVFAGPNGSGKSTVARSFPHFGTFINADDLKTTYNISDLEAAQFADDLRNKLLESRVDFSFETVLSTERNLFLMKKAKDYGFEVQCIYVLTCNPDINVARVRARVLRGGHDVPEGKIRKRYQRALVLLPQIVSVCDKILIYDNSVSPALIFDKNSYPSIFPTGIWPKEQIERLLGL